MRLFIAINFDVQTKKALVELQRNLKEQTSFGNFTKEEHLHLTLVFLGEIEKSRVQAIEKMIDNVTTSPFSLNLNGIGRFRRDDGDIVWVGIVENSILNKLHEELCEGLKLDGFKIENRKFVPHLTIARKVNLKKDFEILEFSKNSPSIPVEVSKISLMKSEQIFGKLTYTEIYAKKC